MSDIEWSDTNEALRHRGLDPIAVNPGRSTMMQFQDAVSSSNVESDGEERGSRDVVVMEKKSLAAIQDTLHRLMTDCDRRQGLITDLIKTNTGLREELSFAKQRRPSSATSEMRVSSTTPIASLLRGGAEDKPSAASLRQLDSVASESTKSAFKTTGLNRVSGDVDGGIQVEGKSQNNNDVNRSGVINSNANNSNANNSNLYLSNATNGKSLKLTSTPLPVFVSGQNQIPEMSSEGHGVSKEDKTDIELREIKRRLLEIEKEESGRRSRRDVVFKQIRKRPPKSRNSADGRLLDVIDVYERELDRISGGNRDDTLGNSLAALDSELDVMVEAPEVRKSSKPEVAPATRNYDRELRDAESAMRKWKSEMKKLKQEIDSRPTRQDLDDAQKRVSELQRLLVEQQRNSSRRVSREENYPPPPPPQGLDEAVLCLDKLKSRLGVQSSLDVVDKVDFLCKVQSEGRKAEKLLKKVNEVVEGGEEGHKLWCHSSGVKLLQTLKKWKSEMNEIPQIHRNFEQLNRRLTGSVETSTTAVTGKAKTPAKELLFLSETLLKDNSLPSFDSVKKIDDANKQTMVLIISHFQNLFDVEEVPNVITRMNDVYNRMKETQNIMKSLREMLGLDNKTPAGWAVVDAVAQLSNALNASSTRRLQEVLGVGDLESVVSAVGEHRDFCPVFTRVLQKVMEVLVVDNLDQVLPAIQSLKLLATPAPLHEDDDLPLQSAS